jgi:hypothetical protein
MLRATRSLANQTWNKSSPAYRRCCGPRETWPTRPGISPPQQIGDTCGPREIWPTRPGISPPRGPLRVPRQAVSRCACVTRRSAPSHADLRPARSPRFPKGLAAGGAEMCMRRLVAPAVRSRQVVPVGPTTCSAALRSAVQLRRRRGPLAARGPSWVPRPVVPRGAGGSIPVMRSRRWRSASGWAVQYSPW